MAAVTAHTPTASTSLPSATQARYGLMSRLLSWWETRRASQQLSQLDDRLLADIGLDRSEIDHVVRHGRSSQR